MPGIIEGYNYDIFISYRQKDNKYDGWVTEFVENLKKELEATFKEDISVYFDENPHDRLKETHDVDKSIEDKLKCLIFIPILSQTYCDPNSYAWQYEFLAFLQVVKNDRFGKDIKLRGGNVASRILPIRIHDLEPDDVKLFEKEAGSVLRSLDFVYSTATGVNRPLQPEDSRNDNLNKTLYRDQINKVAGAIKEIILGIKAEQTAVHIEKALFKESDEGIRKEETKPEREKTVKAPRFKLLSGVFITAILITASIIAYPRLFKKDRLEKYRAEGKVSVAVMPFQNLTNDIEKNFWQEMIQDNLITLLSNSEELKVRQIESIRTLIQNNDLTDYASITPSVASSISQKLDANVFVHGSISQAGTIMRLNAKLVDSDTEEVFKSFQIDGTPENILQISDSLSGLIRDFLLLSVLNKEIPRYWNRNLQKNTTTDSPEAYKYFIRGGDAFAKRDYPEARSMFFKALAIDSNFTDVLLVLPFAFDNQGLIAEGRFWARKVSEKKENMITDYQKFQANFIHAAWFETPYEEIKYLKQYLDEIDDQAAGLYWQLGLAYTKLHQHDKSISPYEKSLDIFNERDIRPGWVYSYTILGYAYHVTGERRKEKRLLRKAERDFPGDHEIIGWQIRMALIEGDIAAADKHTERYISVRKESSIPDANIKNGLANIYSEAGMINEAEETFREALSLEPSDWRRNQLSYFLIDNDRNVNEGLELVDTVLKTNPDNYDYLDTKGWGLYKQSKYKEALEILQKSWDLRRQNAMYNHEAFLHLEAAKKAVAGQ